MIIDFTKCRSARIRERYPAIVPIKLKGYHKDYDIDESRVKGANWLTLAKWRANRKIRAQERLIFKHLEKKCNGVSVTTELMPIGFDLDSLPEGAVIREEAIK